MTILCTIVAIFCSKTKCYKTGLEGGKVSTTTVLKIVRPSVATLILERGAVGMWMLSMTVQMISRVMV